MNQHYNFHVAYYECLSGKTEYSKSVSESNKKLIETTYKASSDDFPLTEESFFMKTKYPGAVIGLGANHDAAGEETLLDKASKDDAVKGGITLDYVTGMPYWPGASVKGTVRNAFETRIKKKEKEETYLVKEMLEDYFSEKIPMDVYKALVVEIFGSEIGAKLKGSKKGPEKRGDDTFLDAVIVKPDKNGKILGFDHVTSHNLTKQDRIGMNEPQPVKMFKILPGVTFLFRFVLKDSQVYEKLTKEVKMELYQAILDTSGMGAKTKVGYGALESTVDGAYKELVPVGR